MNIMELQIARDKLLKGKETPGDYDYTDGVLDMYHAIVKLEKGEK